MGKSIIIYVVSFGFSIYFAYLYQKSSNKKKNSPQMGIHRKFNLAELLNFTLIIICPVIVGAVRQGIGTDYWNYLRYYNQFDGIYITQIPKSMEPLYALLNYLSSLLFGGRGWGLFFLTTLLTVVLVVLTLNYYKDKLSIAMGLFIFYMSFYITSLNIIRQMIAVVIVLYSYRFILENKYKKYILTILAAALFHFTALICLPFVFLDFKDKAHFKNKKLALYFFVLLSPIVIHLVFKYSEYIPLLSTYMANYETSFNGYGIGFLIDIGLVLGPLLFYRKKLIAENPKYDLFINVSLVSIPIRLIVYHQPFASRLFLYFSCLQIIAIPLILNLLKGKREHRYFKALTVIVYALYFVYKFILLNSGEAFPYQSIFQ